MSIFFIIKTFKQNYLGSSFENVAIINSIGFISLIHKLKRHDQLHWKLSTCLILCVHHTKSNYSVYDFWIKVSYSILALSLDLWLHLQRLLSGNEVSVASKTYFRSYLVIGNTVLCNQTLAKESNVVCITMLVSSLIY